MNESRLEKRLRGIFADVFDVSKKEINDESSPETIENWDSLRHLQLTMALEEDFGISLSTDEIIEMLSFKDAKSLLMKQLEIV